MAAVTSWYTAQLALAHAVTGPAAELLVLPCCCRNPPKTSAMPLPQVPSQCIMVTPQELPSTMRIPLLTGTLCGSVASGARPRRPLLGRPADWSVLTTTSNVHLLGSTPCLLHVYSSLRPPNIRGNGHELTLGGHSGASFCGRDFLDFLQYGRLRPCGDLSTN